MQDTRIGLIAGKGNLPIRLINKWREMGITPVVVRLKGITPPEPYSSEICGEFSIGQAGHILNFFQRNNVQSIVMAGALSRPNLWTLKTDRLGLTIISKIIGRRVGDDTLLKTIRKAIESYGMNIMGAHEFMPEILAPVGVIGEITPDAKIIDIAEKGFKAAQDWGRADKGQSIIINTENEILYEGRSGTNALIKSSASMPSQKILVKTSKPQQDLALDMPTIGPETVEQCARVGISGIVVEAGKTIILDMDKVVALCDQYKIFLMGMNDGRT